MSHNKNYKVTNISTWDILLESETVWNTCMNIYLNIYTGGHYQQARQCGSSTYSCARKTFMITHSTTLNKKYLNTVYRNRCILVGVSWKSCFDC